jgi:uncharacterized protein YlbG (UPF0298 family)
MKEKIEKIIEKVTKAGCVWDYEVGAVKYGSWGLVIYTCHKDVERKLRNVFGECHIGQDTQGKFFFWPVNEVVKK